ncbi:MAG: hypothetical protein MMC33_000924 [Icmadophila ericetorum]|nr:hypothetical protein [Icmadophila ericetorum]
MAISAKKTNLTAWRQDGLLAAAKRTGLHITIPQQPVFSEDEIKELMQAPGIVGQNFKRGHALAWLGHLHAVKAFLATDLPTALIIEDDLDWDLSLRNQTRLLAPAVSNFTNAVPSTGPYGLDWDLLWLGHCGDNWQDPTSRTFYADSNVLTPSLQRGAHHDGFPTSYRVLHTSSFPICSFAYALTRTGAQRMLNWSTPSLTPSPVLSSAFDLHLSTGCFNRRIDCVTVNPEIMHHHRQGGGKYSSIDEPGEGVISEHDYTWNIEWSARCNRDMWRKEELVQCLPGPDDP